MSIHQTIKKSIAKKTLVLSAFAFTCLCSAAAIVANSNFSGDWKLNEQKSDLGQFGARMAPKSMKIDAKNESLSTERQALDMQGQPTTTKETLTFDGKETESTVFGTTKKKSTAKWSEDGKTLNVNSTILFDRDGQQTEIKVTEKWKLSDDGQTLTVEQSSSSSFGDNSMKLVYDKSK